MKTPLLARILRRIYTWIKMIVQKAQIEFYDILIAIVNWFRTFLTLLNPRVITIGFLVIYGLLFHTSPTH